MESDPNGRSARVSLLMDHRDHYSHSMYVFVLGLAIYETNAGFRKAFRDFYRLGSEDGGKDGDEDGTSTEGDASPEAQGLQRHGR